MTRKRVEERARHCQGGRGPRLGWSAGRGVRGEKRGYYSRVEICDAMWRKEREERPGEGEGERRPR